MAENTNEKQGGGFKKGTSGNPSGRPKGALNRTTLACQELLDGEAEALTRKAVKMALQGDIMALRLCLERIVPPRKEQPINVKLPKIKKDADRPIFTAALLEAVANGELTVSEAQSLQTFAKENWKIFDSVRPFDLDDYL
jgi:hypothetical protein